MCNFEVIRVYKNKSLGQASSDESAPLPIHGQPIGISQFGVFHAGIDGGGSMIFTARIQNHPLCLDLPSPLSGLEIVLHGESPVEQAHLKFAVSAKYLKV